MPETANYHIELLGHGHIGGDAVSVENHFGAFVAQLRKLGHTVKGFQLTNLDMPEEPVALPAPEVQHGIDGMPEEFRGEEHEAIGAPIIGPPDEVIAPIPKGRKQIKQIDNVGIHGMPDDMIHHPTEP